MKKVFVALVIALVSIVLMSHNTYAITLTNDIEFVGFEAMPYMTIENSLSGTYTCSSNCRLIQQTAGGGGQITSLIFKKSTDNTLWHFYEGDVFQISLVVVGAENISSAGAGFYISPIRASATSPSGADLGESFSYTTNIENISARSAKINYYMLFNEETELKSINLWNWNAQRLLGLGAGSFVQVDNAYLYKYVGSTAGKIDDLSQTIQDQQQQETDATNNAVQDSQDTGQDSSDAATAGTGSLISAIGSAVAAITSASPTNCLINGNMGNLNVGQIDLCSNPVPSFVSIIGSLLLVLFIVPLCISLFNRFINLFRSFQS